MKSISKRAKKIIIIAITAAVVLIAMIIASVVYFINVEIGIYDLSSAVAVFGWEDYIKYSMLSDELKSIISEEEFNDSSDEGRLSMYKKLEKLIIDDRPTSEFKGSTSWFKPDYMYHVKMDNEEYCVYIRIDFDEKFFSPEVVNFTANFISVSGNVKSAEESEPVKSDSVLCEETTVVSDTEATAISSEKIIETTLQTPQQSVSSAENSADESDSDTVIWEAPNGELFYKKDAVQNGSILEFDKAIYRPSTGVFYDSFTNPELFDAATYDFLGELIEYDESNWRCIQTGDTVNGYRVKKAETLFNINDDAYLREDGYIPLGNSIVFEDDITLTGYLTYYSYDDPTFIRKGDLYFLPDESYAGMPLVNFYPYSSSISGESFVEFVEPEKVTFPIIYSDSLSIWVGNLFTDYADNATLKQMIEDNEKKCDLIRVEITLGELSLTFHDMMIWVGTSAKIVNVQMLE